ncbi:MAG: DMT family transporter [Lachnospiraceae bacterium]|nr:DMT family transporter [Lachnospiraceae bacterium]
MEKTSIKSAIILIITSVIWGIGFVAQRAGGEAFPPYTFNASRFILGGLVLLPLVVFIRKKDARIYDAAHIPPLKNSITAGAVCGVFLAFASTLQQLGITIGHSAGKAAFLTACYIVLVPVIGVFFGRKCPLRVWVAVGITLVGLYLLCAGESLALSPADILLLLCALCFAGQILMIDRFVKDAEAVPFACTQFFMAGFLVLIPAVCLELVPDSKAWCDTIMAADSSGWEALIYAGIGSSAGGYTLQIVGQKGIHPTVASVIMSLESVFGVLSGWLILGEKLSPREIAGCVLIFAAVLLAQIPFSQNLRKKIL